MTANNKFSKFVWVVCTAILVLLSACQSNPDPSPQTSLTEVSIGYCPTMEPHILSLAETHTNLIPIRYDNSAVAMGALHAGLVDAIIIGRAAWMNERTDDLRLVRLADGLTLIAQQPGAIRYEDVPKIRIFTHEDEASIQALIPVRINVLYYDDFDQMRTDMDGSVAVLLRWSQVLPTDNLLIPVDQEGLKIPGFRSPHFYYLTQKEETLAPLISTFSVD